MYTKSIGVIAATVMCLAANAANAQIDDLIEEADGSDVSEEQDYETIPVEPVKAREKPETLDESGSQRLEEIVVTAQKREQYIYDVPMSITALSGDALEKMGMDNLRDIAAATPSFSVMESGPGIQHLQIRGISSAHGQATVGYQLDNVSLSTFSLAQPDAATFDLASVEILRGPQGTLYGEGSMGGTVKLITQKPRIGEWEFVAKSDGFITDGADPGLEANAAVNVPLWDSAALRIVGGVADLGGYIDQVELGQDNYNEAQKKNARARFQWEPGERWTIGLTGLTQSIEAGSVNAADENYQRFDGNEIGIWDDGNIASVDINWTPDWADVLLTASRFSRENTVIFDARDSITAELTTGAIPIVGAIESIDELLQGFAEEIIRGSPGGYDVASESESAELRLNSIGGSALNWTVGAYARRFDQSLNLNAKINLAADVQLPIVGGPPGLPSIPLIDVTTDSKSTAKSLFGQLEYDWTSWLNTAAGVRYYKEDLQADSSGRAVTFDAASSDSLSYSAVTKRFALSMRAPDNVFEFLDRAMLYATYAEGFRSGGANIQASPEIPPTYDPDHLKSFEVGGKFEMWGGVLVAEMAVYLNQWTDVQVVVVPEGGTGNFTAISNQGDVEGRGIDWNLIYKPAPRISLYLAGGLIDTSFVTDADSKKKGDPVDFVSPFTGSAGFSIGFNWPSGYLGAFRLDYSYSDVARYQRDGSYDYYSDPVNMLNGRLSVELEAVQFALYGRNLLDNEGALDANQPERQSRARPPSYGIEAKITF
ncbi:TonB-dependent receptor [Sinimarinibacterium sp. CAU 1509]|uniref:TonB-dependent receptor n=1 Tax=Sinimarinibacterium sp. CAU 1509 TaxID=2562283 RepID=UPI0010AB6731|nr:TonB-dependent receptor [Sinimarinibacterium sp. CAU 1509]TJY59725.1 TonB-dependent receptor [Sinimarinibacterium sp. CAU 1509]